MARSLSHRGPDDSDFFVDAAAGIAFAHTRLAILDLSPTGKQPMHSADGRFVLIYNGEIYNFRDLRQELESLGRAFRGRSDTEVLVEGIAEWGVKRAVERCNGMFAFAVWDRKERRLSLARDRFGEKPLYYGWLGSTFVFGSELKALRAHPEFNAPVSLQSLALYLRFMYVPSPYSIYDGIFKLAPGTILTVDAHAADPASATEIKTYWSAREVAVRAMAGPFEGDTQEAILETERLLRDAVRLRLEADVPLGAFLSGGVDSSTIVALMQTMVSRPVRTFTIGLRHLDSEAKDAHAVAKHLGTEHTELSVSPEHAMQVIPLLPRIYDEPFADSSQIPTYLVSEMTRKYVTVSLSGDGGDELFAGYDRVVWGTRIWNRLGRLPLSARRFLARALGAVPARSADRAAAVALRLVPQSRRMPDLAGKLQKLATFLPLAGPDEMYHDLISIWKDPSAVLGRTVAEPVTAVTDPGQREGLDNFTHRMLHNDIVMSLPDDMLTKVDRASMAVSLEARVPMLDHRLFEFSWRLPLSLKIRDGCSKWVLRQVLYKYVPRELIERPKHGFGIPIVGWLRGPMRSWAEDLLSEKRLAADGFFDPKIVRSRWDDHLAGKRNYHQSIWIILMFQAWLDEIRKDSRA